MSAGLLAVGGCGCWVWWHCEASRRHSRFTAASSHLKLRPSPSPSPYPLQPQRRGGKGSSCPRGPVDSGRPVAL